MTAVVGAVLFMVVLGAVMVTLGFLTIATTRATVEFWGEYGASVEVLVRMLIVGFAIGTLLVVSMHIFTWMVHQWIVLYLT